MNTLFGGIKTENGFRQHPWERVEHNPNAKYYNFREHPELIPQVLEDFKPYAHFESVQYFYELVRGINSDFSIFETNDCAFSGVIKNGVQDRPTQLRGYGRFMFFFRDLLLNLSEGSKEWSLKRRFTDETEPYYAPNTHIEKFTQRAVDVISELNPRPIWNCVMVELYPVYYHEAPVPEPLKMGHQFSFNFWAWGNDEAEVMNNFGRVVDTMNKCLLTLNKETF